MFRYARPRQNDSVGLANGHEAGRAQHDKIKITIRNDSFLLMNARLYPSSGNHHTFSWGEK